MSFKTSSFIQEQCSGLLFCFKVFGYFYVIFMLFISTSIPLWFKNNQCMISVLLSLLWFILWLITWSIMVCVLQKQNKNACSSTECHILQMSVRSCWLRMLSSFTTLLFSCLVVSLIVEWGLLNLKLWLRICPFCLYSYQFWLHLFCCSIDYGIHNKDCYVFLVDWSYHHIISLSQVIFFALKSTLLDINMLTFMFIGLLFGWYITLRSFTFKLLIMINMKLLSSTQQMVGFCIFIHPANLCLNGIFRPCTFTLIIDIEGLSLLFYFSILLVSFFYFSVLFFLPSYGLLEQLLEVHFDFSIVFISFFL